MLDNLLILASDPAAWVALVTLIVMEVVLGIDNLIFISILTNKLPADLQTRARRIGIGLALARALVELHGGTVSAHSAGPGTGSRFVVCLPRLENAKAASGAAALPIGRTARRLLLVDDNADMRTYASRVLSARWEVEAVGDGRAALAAARHRKPDLILTDIMMPQMSGFQVCRKLKADPKTHDIQILMVTALNELGDIEQANECGTDDFVSKPVNKIELLTRVKSLLRVRHLKSELERALTYLNEIEQEEETL